MQMDLPNIFDDDNKTSNIQSNTSYYFEYNELIEFQNSSDNELTQSYSANKHTNITKVIT